MHRKSTKADRRCFGENIVTCPIVTPIPKRQIVQTRIRQQRRTNTQIKQTRTNFEKKNSRLTARLYGRNTRVPHIVNYAVSDGAPAVGTFSTRGENTPGLQRLATVRNSRIFRRFIGVAAKRVLSKYRSAPEMLFVRYVLFWYSSNRPNALFA